MTGEGAVLLEADVARDLPELTLHAQRRAAPREHAQVEVDDVPAEQHVGIELAHAPHDALEQPALVGVADGAFDLALRDEVRLLDAAADERHRVDAARVGRRLDVERQHAQLGALDAGAQHRVAEQHEAALARLLLALDRRRRADAVVDQVAVGEADVGLVGRHALAGETVAQRRDQAGRRHGDPHHRAAVHVAQLVRLDGHARYLTEQPDVARAQEEVRSEAVVLDEERPSVHQSPEELHHRALVAHLVGRLEDQPGRHRSASAVGLEIATAPRPPVGFALAWQAGRVPRFAASGIPRPDRAW